MVSFPTSVACPGGWVLAKWTESAALLIFGGGAMTVGAIGAMAGLTLLETWCRLPFIDVQDNPDSNRSS